MVITFAESKVYQRRLESSDADRARVSCAKFNARSGRA
jgi:hypothetical protein